METWKKKIWQNKLLWIFDLDGTLVDAYQAICASLNWVRKKFKLQEISLDSVKKAVGRGERDFIKQFFPVQLEDEALNLYRQIHKIHLKDKVFLRKGAEELLNCLVSQKKKIALASNRPRIFTQIIINNMHLNKYIKFLLCGDDVKEKKPNPEMIERILKKMQVLPEKAVFIGDMDIDLQTASQAKVESIFINGGSGDLNQIINLPCLAKIEELTELLLN